MSPVVAISAQRASFEARLEGEGLSFAAQAAKPVDSSTANAIRAPMCDLPAGVYTTAPWQRRCLFFRRRSKFPATVAAVQRCLSEVAYPPAPASAKAMIESPAFVPSEPWPPAT